MSTGSRLSAEKILQRPADNRDHFRAVPAYELRNPLGALKSAVKVAQLAGNEPLPRDRALEIVSGQITQMAWLIENSIDANRVARGGLRLQLRRIELKPLLGRALATVRPRARQKEQIVAFTTPSDPIYLNAESLRVAQIVANSLNKAGKFTEIEGRISLDVKSCDEAGVAIHASDSGGGLGKGSNFNLRLPIATA